MLEGFLREGIGIGRNKRVYWIEFGVEEVGEGFVEEVWC